MPWPKITITTDNGERHKAIAPVIISASRSTDIPAFYGEWFLRRLASGYVRWNNPWSGKELFVSFSQARLFVFWSKNPRPFFPVLDELDRRGIKFLFHFTVNDYEHEGLEPLVPRIDERIKTFKRLSARIGRQRLIWRFDPLLITDYCTTDRLIGRIEKIGNSIASCADRLIISFITEYPKVSRNLRDAGIRINPWDGISRDRILRGIGALCASWKLPVGTCANDIEGTTCGIGQGKCIDEKHIERVWSTNDTELMRYLSHEGGAKDRGQRPLCRCIKSKDIGGYNTCGHSCVYCYANSSPTRARRSMEEANASADSIGGHSSSISSGSTAGSSLS
jgi:hypothetical protein